MALETGSYIANLVAANPPGSDPKSGMDNHLRLIKGALLNCFPGFAGAVVLGGVDTGVADAYVLTPTTALLAYSTGMLVMAKLVNANATTTPTLNVSGLGAKTIKNCVGGALLAGDLVAGQYAAMVYDGTAFNLVAVTKNYVDQLAFSAVLPVQPGGALTYALSSTGGAAAWVLAYPSMTSKASYFLTNDGTNTASWSNAIKASVIRIADGTDATKRAAFDLSGLTTGTTRTLAVQDKDGTLAMTSDTTALVVKVSDRKSSGTGGGTATAATISQTRTLNTVDSNTIPSASLSANAVTLPAGTYYFRGRAPALEQSNHKAFLYNSTDSTYAGIGSNASCSGTSGQTSDSVFSGSVTIASSKAFTVRHYTATANANSLGQAVSTGQSEVYTELEFWRIS